MMTDEITPALTPEEWARVKRDVPVMRISTVDDVTSLDPDDKVAAMALANHTLPDGDPRKITRADVALLTEVARDHEAESGDDWHADVAPLRALAAKVAAFLPPSERLP